jgi:hypothetical protein
VFFCQKLCRFGDHPQSPPGNKAAIFYIKKNDVALLFKEASFLLLFA